MDAGDWLLTVAILRILARAIVEAFWPDEI
jgi:hypothetical protein